MSQHDYNIANGGGAAVRADINNALLAILSQNSGATAPTVTKPFMFWFDTTTGALKMRNAADTAWVAAIDGMTGSGPQGMKNRIINGNAVVSQRVSGTLANDTHVYGGADRFTGFISASTVTSGTIIRAAGLGTVSGYGVDLYNVSTTGSTAFRIQQRIESINTKDLNSSVISISGKFYHNIGSTLTMTVGVAKPTTVDTYPTNGSGVTEVGAFTFSAPSGVYTTFSGQITLGSTDASNGLAAYVRTTGLISALSAAEVVLSDFQLEKGTAATSFDYRPISTELALCQRYTQKISADATAIYSRFGSGFCQSTTVFDALIPLKVTMRASPSLTTTGTASNYAVYSGAGTVTPCNGLPSLNASGTSPDVVSVQPSVASGLTSGQGGALISNGNASSYLLFNAEL